MLPIGVVGRTKSRPYAILGLIAVNIIVFIWELSVGAQGPEYLQAALQQFGLEVCKVNVMPPHEVAVDSFRSMFLHGSMAHLLGNMLFLWVFGRRVEGYFGSAKFAIFYLLVGFGATAAHVFFGNTVCSVPEYTGVLIGASGAIAGVMGGFLLLHPGARVETIVGFFRPFMWRMKIPAFFFLGYWLLMDVLQGIGWIYSEGVAHWAHIGGFFVGFAMMFLATMFFKPAPKPDALAELSE